MQQGKNNKAAVSAFSVLTILCMGAIFYFSSRTALESSQQSDSILNFLTKIFGDNVFTEFIVRKSAHCLEFSGLSLLLNCTFYFAYLKKRPFVATFSASLYAVTDEIHQIFTDGRSCEIRDWAIDTVGAVAGTIGFLVIFAIIAKITKKSQKCIDTTDVQL